jgi:hypothetical protein
MQSLREQLINIKQELVFHANRARLRAYNAVMSLVAPDKMKMASVWDIVQLGPDGKVLARRHFFNVMTTTGKTALATALAANINSATQSTWKYMGVGTGVTAAAAGDTALQTELAGSGYARVASTVTSSTNVLQFVATFGSGNPTTSVAVTEAGLFDAATVGTMYNHQVFSAINRVSADSLQITVQVTFA